MKLRLIYEEWMTDADIEQMRNDPPEDPSRLFHVTTDLDALLAGREDIAHTSEFGRQGFHVFDNVDDAEYYLGMLRRKGHPNAAVVQVSIPLEHLKPDNESLGRAYIAPRFLPEYLNVSGTRMVSGL